MAAPMAQPTPEPPGDGRIPGGTLSTDGRAGGANPGGANPGGAPSPMAASSNAAPSPGAASLPNAAPSPAGGPSARARLAGRTPTRSGVPLGAFAALATAMLLAGLCVTLGKMALAHLTVVALAGPRCVAAALFLVPLALAEAGRGPSARAVLAGMGAREWVDLVAQAFFGIVAFTLLMLGGVALTSAGEAGLIAATMPLAILVLALPLLGEGLRARPLVAALVATLGIAVVTFADPGTETAEAGRRWLGNLLVAGAVVSEALYTLFAKRLAARLPPATMALLLNVIGLVLFAPLLALQPWGALIRDVPWTAWGLAALYGVLTSGLALVLWYRGTRWVTGGVAGLFTVFLPVGAIVSGVLLLDETVEPHQAAGAAVIALALLIGLAPGRWWGWLRRA